MGDRIFLDWRSPMLAAAASWVLDSAGGGESREIDLARTVCVVPGNRAARLLRYEIVRRSNERRCALLPPQIVTPGSLDRALVRTRRAAATSLERRLAWWNAIARTPRPSLAPLHIDPRSDRACDALADTLVRLDADLTAGERSFREVAAVIARCGFADDGARWQALAGIEAAYLDALASAGLVDPARESLRAAGEGDIATDLNIVLIAVPELNARQRRLLGACSGRITALVHAPADLADGFDELGCVIQGTWSDRPVDLGGAPIHLVEHTRDQARRVMSILAAFFAGGGAPDEITIGLGDEALQPTLQRAGAWAGAPLHAAAGEPLSQTAPLLLLERAADWLEEPRFAHLAALLRHPDVERVLRNRFDDDEEARKGVSKWVGLLETYFANHLHDRFDGSWLGNADDQERLRTVWDAVQSLFAPLSGASKPLGAWCGPLIGLLSDVYGHLPATGAADRARTIDACRALAEIIASFGDVHEALQHRVTAAEAIRIVFDEAARGAIAAAARPRQIEMLGWLELHLDPAPRLVLTGFNDGGIPGSAPGDPFLPDALRAALGLACNESRAARDAYLLSAIIASRERVDLIVARRGELDEPLTPSRFLFQTNEETILRRVRELTAEEAADVDADAPPGLPPPGAASAFRVPRLPEKIAPPESMRITEFKTFLACPYRWALQRALRLESIDPPREELSPLRFGNIAHQALENFGNDPDIRSSLDPRDITAYLDHELDRIARDLMGPRPLPAAAVQIANLKQRLRDFARRQAQWAAEGWEIRFCEIRFGTDNPMELDIPGQAGMPLRGTIDRIDFNPRLGRWRIIDYKTGDAGGSPHIAHHGSDAVPPAAENRWQDLQLPLYHYLVRRAGITDGGEEEIGYIVLPRGSGGARFIRADWSSDLLAEAVEVAREVVRRIRQMDFEMNRDFPRYDPFRRICQSNVFGGPNLPAGQA